MATCYRTKKPRFTSKLEADLSLLRVVSTSKHHRKMANREVPQRSYECEFCSGWHLTSQGKRMEQAN